ncbi:MAG: DNRLRE domain-containing protein, partial [Omnitrophica WOR_2 bacterium]
MISKAVLLLISILVITLVSQSPFAVAQPSQSDISIPFGALVTSADFIMYVETPPGGAATVKVHRIIKNWTEDNVAFNNMVNQFDPVVSASFNPTAAGWYTTSITTLVQNWVDGVYPNYGIAIEQGNDPFTSYASSESTTITHRPKLTICYIPPGGSNTCLIIQRLGAAQDGVADTYICSCS